MSRVTIPIVLAAATAILLGAARQARASTILLDFGPTAPSNADGSSTNSPGHDASAWSSSAPTWNIVQDSDVSSGGVFSISGATATGVALDLAAATGTSTAGPAAVTFGDTTNQPNASNALGNAYNQGIYANSSPTRDGIFENPNNVYTAVGLNVTGLSAGTYTIYATARNTNTSGGLSNPENVWINATSASGSYTIPATATELESNPAGDFGTSGFVNGQNYVLATVTLTADSPNLTIITEGTTPTATGESRGFLNSVEIVPTPEPAALGILTGAIGLVLRRRRAC